ncbi:SET domain protein [Akanthomyces lecanii RCEF 1005]|uniref:SET domain protein n=1 Tax=Akanthomyces lecanii RCEF 1005 TaxID=1081108 RepID=A0A168HMT8_CORDF|nr:SET domain protein [Akanthomyces lecanii RCEF 1005]
MPFRTLKRDRAHIYELTCYINHACSSCANAEFWVDSDWPNSITVKLVRDVNKGDEIFICYHKPNLHFGSPNSSAPNDDRSNNAEPSAATDSSASDDTPSDVTLVDSSSSQTRRRWALPHI